MRTTDLSGALLDYWVARAMGAHFPVIECGACFYDRRCLHFGPYEPSTFEPLGDTVLRVAGVTCTEFPSGRWGARMWVDRDAVLSVYGYGPTRLVAGCRALVASVFGDEVGETPAVQGNT